MDRDEHILKETERFLKEKVAPNAQRIDRDPEAIREAISGLCNLDLMALKRPLAYGGPEISDQGIQRFQEMVARYSGALAFLQTRHQTASAMIGASPNEALKDEYLPLMGGGQRSLGVAFSHFRRVGLPMVRADRTSGGYKLSGSVPWITGWGFYPEFLIGASLADGRVLFAPVPFKNHEHITISPPMEQAAMNSAMTVSAEISGFFVPDERVALIRDRDWIHQNDQQTISQQGSFAMGCAQAGLDILFRNAKQRELCAAETAHDRLSAELEHLRTTANQSSDQTTAEKLDLRAWQIELAVRCAHAAVASSSGAANSSEHPAQRVYREALAYTVIAQTGPVMEATLKRICC